MVNSDVHFSPVDPNILRAIGVNDTFLFEPTQMIFTNRDLDLSEIEMVGFDMDYTLARYHKAPMEHLQYRLTVENLIQHHHYPTAIRQLPYDPSLIIRGLIVDKRRGHLLKTDVHGQVWRAIHGRRHLSAEEIEEIYGATKLKISSNQFASIDTLFSLPEASLYCNLIDYFTACHARGEAVTPLEPTSESDTDSFIDTAKLFDTVRQTIDKIHSDESLKSIITKDLKIYVESDTDIALTLHKLRSSGKKLFLLTNSHWEYTNAVMSYLLDGRLNEYSSWRAYFEIVIVGSSKPSFFTTDKQFEVVDVASGQTTALKESTDFDRNTIYQGGSLRQFETMSKCRGEKTLYIGDHIFGDILRSKKESLWNTCLVVEELENEIQLQIEYAQDIDWLFEMDSQRHSIDALIGHHRALLAHLDAAGIQEPAKIMRKEIDLAKRYLKIFDQRAMVAQDEVERRFHPIWGRLFREHRELSRFGEQVTVYASIYTGKLTNFLKYSPLHVFRSASEQMNHDRVLQNTKQVRRARLPPVDIPLPRSG